MQIIKRIIDSTPKEYLPENMSITNEVIAKRRKDPLYNAIWLLAITSIFTVIGFATFLILKHLIK